MLRYTTKVISNLANSYMFFTFIVVLRSVRFVGDKLEFPRDFCDPVGETAG